ncbi:MAG: hypothetical protein WC884_04160 [Candidatus Paceibacterota bacterium]
MNSITEIKDCLIVEEIERIQILSIERLQQELIEVKTRRIEEMSNVEILKMCQRNKNGN